MSSLLRGRLPDPTDKCNEKLFGKVKFDKNQASLSLEITIFYKVPEYSPIKKFISMIYLRYDEIGRGVTDKLEC